MWSTCFLSAKIKSNRIWCSPPLSGPRIRAVNYHRKCGWCQLGAMDGSAKEQAKVYFGLDKRCLEYKHSYRTMLCECSWIMWTAVVCLLMAAWILRKVWIAGCHAKTFTYCQQTPLNKFVLDRCTRIHKGFWIPFWAQYGHVQTVLDSLFKPADVTFNRELIQLKDGGEVAIDWAYMKNNGLKLPDTTPVLLVLPGLTGDAVGMSHLCHMALLRGYRPFVFNKRGHGGTKLKTPKMQSFGDPSDLREAILHVKSTHPNSKLTAVGHSAGSGLLVSYLGEYCPDSGIAIAVCVSPGYDAAYLFEHCLGQPYNFILLRSLKKLLKQHRDVLANVMDVDKCLKVRNLAAFEEEFYCKLYGYETMEQYWNCNNPLRAVDKIDVPVLCISGLDDPVCNKECIAYSLALENEKLLLVTTTKGGHCGFHEGTDLECWADKLGFDYMSAVLDFSTS